MKKTLNILFIAMMLAAIAVPFIVDAQLMEMQANETVSGFFCSSTPKTFKDVICIFVSLLLKVIPLLISVAFLVFFWGLVRFIANAGNETAREEAKNIMFWGVIGLFVMVSIMGIIGLFMGDFWGNGSVGIPSLPYF